LLSVCGEHLEKDNGFQAVAVVGISLIAMGEEIGSEMCLRTFDRLLQYGDTSIKRAVPLALGLISISNPRITVMDTLSKLSHDSDSEVAMCAIFALGLIGAGSNNSRIGGLLIQLSGYYYRDPNCLFVVRLAQGLLHLGKGTLTLSPFHSHNLLMSRVAVSGILIVLHACFDIKNTILTKSHFLLFCLCSAMYPRMLMTFDEELKPIPVPVRVGQAVDTVGQAGKPKSITGFQTHTTPVLLGSGERAELATDEYVSCSNVLEGFVILKKKGVKIK
jgi:26S proteasome regulatory subunit N1